VGPTQFMTQRVTDWKGLVEEPHIPEIRSIEAFPKLLCQRRGQYLEQAGSVLGPCRPALLKFDDVPADLPASADLHRVDGTQSTLTSTLNQFAEAAEKAQSSSSTPIGLRNPLVIVLLILRRGLLIHRRFGITRLLRAACCSRLLPPDEKTQTRPQVTVRV